MPKHAQQFQKNLRALVYPQILRFYLVGEYGDISERPHYHAIVFGLSPLQEKLVSRAWTKGFTYVGELTPDSAQYVAGYVTKKMTSKDDPRLKGRHPEFMRCSNRPGIAALAVEDIADVLTSSAGATYISFNDDVPSSLSHGTKKLPLGRYLKKKLREKLGFPEEKIHELFLLWQTQNLEEYEEGLKLQKKDGVGGGHPIVYKNRQRRLNFEAKQNVFKGRTKKI